MKTISLTKISKYIVYQMIEKLANIVDFQSGVYAKPGIGADTLYLQSIHFSNFGEFENSVRPVLKLDYGLTKHLLNEGDLLFAAKGLNNFAVVYRKIFGQAVASSSFIVLRIKPKQSRSVSPEFLSWLLSHDRQVKLLHSKQLGTTIPSISIAQLKEITITIPPVDVQRKIVAVQKLYEKEIQINDQLAGLRKKQIQHLLSKSLNK